MGWCLLMKKDEELVSCSRCVGSGRVSRIQSYGAFSSVVYEDCSRCKGKGKVKKK